MQSPASTRVNFYILLMTLLLPILLLTAVISLASFSIIYLISCLFPNLGKFLSCNDAWLYEDFVNSVPQGSIVISLSLQDDLTLNQLKSIFQENVLNAQSKRNPNKPRYPELKQFVSSFLCFRVWKNDPNFSVENHIKEQTWNESDLDNLHQENINKTFEKGRSPWELILMRNVNSNYDSEDRPKTLLIFRVHHVMADSKSMLKLLVECLGQKKLKTAKPQYIQRTRWDEIFFILNFPWKYIRVLYRFIMILNSTYHHPWASLVWISNPKHQSDKQVVAFSPKVRMSILKQVAKENSVRTSAVVLSIIAEAIKKCCGDSWNQDVAISYPLSKPNHPESLTNHAYMNTLRLAADQPNCFKRLQKCNDELVRLKEEQQGRLNVFGTSLGGVQMYPMSRLIVNAFYPIGITNNAGEEEGFSVGNAECVDYRMSVGTQRGTVGVIFCTISYKDGMRIAVIAKESVLPKDMVDSLARQIEFELQSLKTNLK